ncbi:hypothetical protein CROQUDRAFT_102790 [Cronartium quercuum f. sp. fusiforme G11]|uniref:Uncharacterized protein n=1 Tax=Cronartium quercuum f. sp. fusiforme G11 TaxID=708437 RepID=A0A9P6T543_9BASI|nr:hypothetical protein CROQUDRAFT_102790 [Cronartium quercuum f. sp. fusiforme G11]
MTTKPNEDKKPNPWNTRTQANTTSKAKEPPKFPNCGSNDATHQWKTCKGKQKAIKNKWNL